MKRDVEAKGGNNVVHFHYLYRERILHLFENGDLDSLEKYMNEMESVYQKVTGVSRIYLYNSKIHYATLAGNLAEWIAYFPLFMGLCMSTDVFKCKELVI